MEDWSAHHLYLQAKPKLGNRPAESLKTYAQRLMRSKLPVVFTLRHLSKIVNVDYSLLRATAGRFREAANYRMFAIKKRSGGRRHIHAVSGKLLRTQQFINSEILQKLEPHHASFAFHPEGGIRACASMHCGARWLFQYDLKDFFYSINEADVYKVFVDAGYRPLLSFELARICTTLRLPIHLKHLLRLPQSSKTYDLYQRNIQVLAFGYFPGFFPMGVLPQGAPTSPMLSNLVARKLDESLSDFADRYGFVYTRYADDITLSTAEDLPNGMSIGDLNRAVVGIIRKNKFRENPKKTRVAGPGANKTVLGLLVDSPQPRLSKEVYKRIDRHLHATLKYGIISVSQYEKFDSVIGYYNHLAGLIAFVKDVDIVRWREFHAKFMKIPPPIDPC
jgi:RNA-directed DNA polymerase